MLVLSSPLRLKYAIRTASATAARGQFRSLNHLRRLIGATEPALPSLLNDAARTVSQWRKIPPTKESPVRLMVGTICQEPYPGRWESVYRLLAPTTLGICNVRDALTNGHSSYVIGAPPLDESWPLRKQPVEEENLEILKHMDKFLKGEQHAYIEKATPQQQRPPPWPITGTITDEMLDMPDVFKTEQRPYVRGGPLWSRFFRRGVQLTEILNRCCIYVVPARGNPYGRLIMDYTMRKLGHGWGVNRLIPDWLAGTRLINSAQRYVEMVCNMCRRVRRKLHDGPVLGWWLQHT